MKVLLFIGAYLVAFVPVMFAYLTVCYLLCTLKLLGDCFGRPRATVAVVTHAGMFVIIGALAGFLVCGLYAVASRLNHDPTIPLVLMAVFPGLNCFAFLPAFLREAERDVRGERSQMKKEAAEFDATCKLPAWANLLFVSVRLRRRARARSSRDPDSDTFACRPRPCQSRPAFSSSSSQLSAFNP